MNEMEIIEYINQEMGFYFDGGFGQMIIDAELDQEEIENWLNIAVLYSNCAPDRNSENALSVLEELYSACEVSRMFGEKLEEMDLEDIGDGYDFSRSEYEILIKDAHNFLVKNGLNLISLVKKATPNKYVNPTL